MKFSFYFILIWSLSISCKKNPVNESFSNRAPVANAGADLSITLFSCSGKTGVISLDGSNSFDPDGNIRGYRWTKVAGPSGSIILSNSTSVKASVENLSAGQYEFELAVTDVQGLSSRDTMVINVVGVPSAYDVDITFNSHITSVDNFLDCGWDYDVNATCQYYDWTEIDGEGNFLPVGKFKMTLNEQADTAAMSDVIQSQNIFIYTGTESVWGTTSINFKKLIRNGGGAFNGTFKILGGSAEACAPSVFDNLAPLTVTGDLDLARAAVNLRITGKVYF